MLGFALSVEVMGVPGRGGGLPVLPGVAAELAPVGLRQVRAVIPRGLGEVRGQRRPSLRGRALARIRRGQHADAVARAAATTDRDGLRRQTPLRVLDRRVTTPGTRQS